MEITGGMTGHAAQEHARDELVPADEEGHLRRAHRVGELFFHWPDRRSETSAAKR